MTNTQTQLLKKANAIKKLGIASLIIHIVAIILFFAWLVTTLVMFTNMNADGNIDSLNNTQIGMIVAIAIVGTTYFICNLTFGIIAIIKIATTDWENQELNQSKLIFWIISLIFIFFVLVNPIMWIVWGKKVKSNYSQK